MPLSPRAFQTAKILPNLQNGFVTRNVDSFNMDKIAGQSTKCLNASSFTCDLMPHIRLDGPFRALIKMPYEPA
jgi:hypothetical protein